MLYLENPTTYKAILNKLIHIENQLPLQLLIVYTILHIQQRIWVHIIAK